MSIMSLLFWEKQLREFDFDYYEELLVHNWKFHIILIVVIVAARSIFSESLVPFLSSGWYILYVFLIKRTILYSDWETEIVTGDGRSAQKIRVQLEDLLFGT